MNLCCPSHSIFQKLHLMISSALELLKICVYWSDCCGIYLSIHSCFFFSALATIIVAFLRNWPLNLIPVERFTAEKESSIKFD